ncbi:MAG: prephenate dehydrogenase/arogenate dehydrogenase family protein [Bacteroidales bacterium]|nr:prephenate dehydrogenase/arogenate dehydrogenase family protein [Candidatus Cryptobacteroides choladohippi]
MTLAHGKVLIVGLGLIGGSYAEALTKAGVQVGAIDRNRESIDYALGKGIITEGAVVPEREFISRYRLIVSCLYPSDFIGWIRDCQDLIAPGTLITDTSGVKVPVVYEVQRMLRPDLEFIGAHPMAGREKSGVVNSDCSVFKGANYLVTPTAGNTSHAIEQCKELGRMMGFGNISELPPEEHDEMIGFLSQLTHCVAVSLMTCRETSRMAKYSGDSFRDLTRIAAINETMWSELFMLNRDVLIHQIDLFASSLEKLKASIEKGDAQTLREMMVESTRNRKQFDRK